MWKQANKLICNNFQKHQRCIDGLAQDCSNSSADALELLQSCAKPLVYSSREGPLVREGCSSWRASRQCCSISKHIGVRTLQELHVVLHATICGVWLFKTVFEVI